MTKRALLILAVPIACATGCASEHWTPPPPSGVTYQYDYQGFRERRTAAFGGTMSSPGFGMAYGGAFSFRNESELTYKRDADPFAESTPIDGLRFNEHLGSQGIPLLSPSLAPPSSPSSRPPASANPPVPAAHPSSTPPVSQPGGMW